MNIAFGIENDIQHEIGEIGYEWWYYDCVSLEEDYCVVLIFFRDIPMLPACIRERSQRTNRIHNFDGVTISIYHKKKKIAQKLLWSKKYKTFYDQQEHHLQFAQSFVQYSNGHYSLFVDFRAGQDSRRIRFSAEFDDSIIYSNGNTHQTPTEHTWIAVSPKLSGQCNLEIWDEDHLKISKSFLAHAYHDHNIGVMPVFEEFYSWYWGKVVCNFGTLVYYYVPDNSNNSPLHWACIFLDSTNQPIILRDVFIGEGKKKISYAGIYYAKELFITGFTNEGEKIEVNIHQNSTLENGPFYLRFASVATLKINSSIYSDSHSIGEYFHAQRLRSKIVQTFIELPWEEI